ncbi:hypothetical protein Prudu_001381 [Prunus dulcis]|uniref:Uncharacterized protein n=1 Tax=Prunus dulcis TaxID=3755 RepID=A0A4Y1QNL2_PRUDU|nr:hypothetical protein Prudu_001381 [Prunus dulcis]
MSRFDESWIGVPDTPNSQSLGGDDYAEFGAPGSADICCHYASICCHYAALMDHLAVGPAGQEEHPRAVSAVEDGEGHPVTNSRINIRYDERHWAAPTAELHSSLAHDIGHVIQSHCPMQWKSWKTNYNLEDLDDESLAYVNRLFSERIKPKSIRAIGRRRLFSIIRVPGPSPIGWMHGGRGSKFPEIDVFGDVYVRSRNELAESLHVNDDGGEEPVGSSGVRLPTSSRYSDRVCGSSTGCWVSDLDGDLDQTLRRRPGHIVEGWGMPGEGKQSGHYFDSTGGHSSESDVGHFAVPRTVRHSSPAF